MTTAAFPNGFGVFAEQKRIVLTVKELTPLDEALEPKSAIRSRADAGMLAAVVHRIIGSHSFTGRQAS